MVVILRHQGGQVIFVHVPSRRLMGPHMEGSLLWRGSGVLRDLSGCLERLGSRFPSFSSLRGWTALGFVDGLARWSGSGESILGRGGRAISGVVWTKGG